MKLEDIDKTRYRKHLNIVIAVAIAALAGLSLAISQSMIWLFTDRLGTHFWLNLAGVALALVLVATVLNRIKNNAFMREVYYVWRLKQQINYIHRKQSTINKAVDNNNPDAITVMAFYYAACRQLYRLDDNTITLSSLNKKSATLDDKITELNLTIDINLYQQALLDQF